MPQLTRGRCRPSTQRCYRRPQLWGRRKPGERHHSTQAVCVGTADYGLGFHSASNCPSEA